MCIASHAVALITHYLLFVFVSALLLYSLSAGQGSGLSFLKVGDFHYYGMGGLAVDKMEASRYYQAAGDLHNTQALFNLGLMHEFGDGVEKDFHLSKRFFDQAAVYDSNAKIPSAFAVMMLKVCIFMLQAILLILKKLNE